MWDTSHRIYFPSHMRLNNIMCDRSQRYGDNAMDRTFCAIFLHEFLAVKVSSKCRFILKLYIISLWKLWYRSLTISKIGQQRKNWKCLQFAFCTFFPQIQNISYTFWTDNFKKCCKHCAKVCTSYLLSIFLSYDILKCRSMKIGVCKTCAKNIIANLRKMLQN